MCLPSATYQYTFFTGRLFSEAAITLTISRSITLNCCHYDTSEPVMILYYNVIDPVEGLTPPGGCWADNSGLCWAFELNTIKRRWFDYTVNSMIISHAEINSEVYSVRRWDMSCNKISIACMCSPKHTQYVHKDTSQTHLWTNSKLSIFIWNERGICDD